MNFRYSVVRRSAETHFRFWPSVEMSPWIRGPNRDYMRRFEINGDFWLSSLVLVPFGKVSVPLMRLFYFWVSSQILDTALINAESSDFCQDPYKSHLAEQDCHKCQDPEFTVMVGSESNAGTLAWTIKRYLGLPVVGKETQVLPLMV